LPKEEEDEGEEEEERKKRKWRLDLEKAALHSASSSPSSPLYNPLNSHSTPTSSFSNTRAKYTSST
jgi:hypothetical protein